MTTLRETAPAQPARPPAKPKKPKKRKETAAERNARLKKVAAAKKQLRARLVEDDDAVLSFAEWCALNSFSLRQGRKIITSDNRPIVTQLSDRRIGVTRKNNRDWQEKRAR